MIDGRLTSVELFAGAGGLALGVELAGFKSLATVEWDHSACETIRANQRRMHPLVSDWKVHETDVRTFDWASLPEGIDLLAGGPPCQPFSIGGKSRAQDDERDMFPALIGAVRVLRPRAFLVENVKGLLREQFADYYRYILLRLEFPERPRDKGESWEGHLARLRELEGSGNVRAGELRYRVVPTLVNAANYGVPQCRERVLIVGMRSDIDESWSFPAPTHSKYALVRSQKTGEYWVRHGLRAPEEFRQFRDGSGSERESDASAGCRSGHSEALLPWRTVRDALYGLPDPETVPDVHSPLLNHEPRYGAKAYPGHTGSMLDAPSKTLKAGVHGVPGGENMLILDDGHPRYYTVREAARMQTFPDGYTFDGAWSEVMRQLGNAVPVELARIVAASIARTLIADEFGRSLSRNALEERSRS